MVRLSTGRGAGVGQTASWGMWSSGFILFGLEGKMGSFGKSVHGIPWVGVGRGGLPGYRVAGQGAETMRPGDSSGCGGMKWEIKCWSQRWRTR